MSAFERHELLMAAGAQGDLVEIGGVQLVPVEYNGARVLTLAMMDAVHQRPKDTARRNFNEHKKRLIEGEDYFDLTADEIRTQSLRDAFPPRTGKATILTETGYSMLVKSFTDDLAWDVQRQLVKSYFAKPAPIAAPKPHRAVVGNNSLASFRQARALEITTKVAGALCATFPDLDQAAQQNIFAKLINNVAGTEVIPLPAVEQLFSATEIGEKYGVSANAVGRMAIAHGLKIDKYGKSILDKSRSSDKQMTNFHYNAAGVARLGELFGHSGKAAPGNQAQLGFDPPAED